MCLPQAGANSVESSFRKGTVRVGFGSSAAVATMSALGRVNAEQPTLKRTATQGCSVPEPDLYCLRSL